MGKSKLFRARKAPDKWLNVSLIKEYAKGKGITTDIDLMRKYGFAPRLIQKWKREPLASDKVKLITMLYDIGLLNADLLSNTKIKRDDRK